MLKADVRHSLKNLPWASSCLQYCHGDHPTHAPMLTFAAKKLSTGANGRNKDADSPLCQRSCDRAAMHSYTYNIYLCNIYSITCEYMTVQLVV